MEALTIDLETLKLARDLGETQEEGWQLLRQGEGGISTLVMWSNASGRPHIFGESTLDEAVSMLEAADCVLSFNGVGFDIPVIEGVFGRELALKHHVDMLQLIWQAQGEGNRHAGFILGECSERTLGTTKSGDAVLAPQLAEDGEWNTLIDYCLTDVVLTRKLFQYAQNHGGIIGLDGDPFPLEFPPWFGDLKV